MYSWDPYAVKRLESIRADLDEVGVIDFVRTAVVELWRANRDRYEPEELFDDPFTLGVTTSRNLANRLWSQFHHEKRWRESGVHVTREHPATVLHGSGVDVRLVKVPFQAKRRPNFIADFDWANSSEARRLAAGRNHAVYAPPPRQPGLSMLFEIDLPGAEQAVQLCRDVALIWGAELDSGLTAGWLGFPTTSADRWLAVTDLWWDEPTSGPVAMDGGGPQSDDSAFERKNAPKPEIKLKPQRDEGSSQ